MLKISYYSYFKCTHLQIFFALLFGSCLLTSINCQILFFPSEWIYVQFWMIKSFVKTEQEPKSILFTQQSKSPHMKVYVKVNKHYHKNKFFLLFHLKRLLLILTLKTRIKKHYQNMIQCVYKIYPLFAWHRKIKIHLMNLFGTQLGSLAHRLRLWKYISDKDVYQKWWFRY